MSKQNTPVATKPSWKEKYFNIYNTKFTVRGEKYHLGETSVAYALLLPTIGIHQKTAFQSLVEHWVGTENLAYAIYDEPEVVEECIAVIQARDE